MTRRKALNPDLERIGTRLAAILEEKLTAAGYPIDWQVYGQIVGVDGVIVRELQRPESKRQVARYQDRDQWAKDPSVLSWDDLQASWGLTRPEMRAAAELGYTHQVTVPTPYREAFDTPKYFASTPLTEAQRRDIATHTLISRTDAAARLGITPAAFDKLKKERGLQRADTTVTSAGHMLFLYLQSDVDAFKP